MKRLAALLLLILMARADAAPSFYAFLGGAVVRGPDASGVMVPDVVGLSSTDADTALVGVGLITGVITMQCSAAMADNVLIQSPTAGSTALSGAAVDLWVSTGVACVGGSGGLRLLLDLWL